ncbi:MAG: PilZ domain-containing protein [Elusimicrobiota bacterium]
MKHPNGKRSAERRRHPRVAVVSDLVEPIVLRYAPDIQDKRKSKDDAKSAAVVPKHLRTQPAILTNLSEGGMSLVTFLAPPHAKIFKMTLTIPGLDQVPVEGKVVRVQKKGETFVVGIQFTKIAMKYRKKIAQMADDDIDCKTRISLGLPEACVPKCSFHLLCTKTQKAPHWPPKF